MSLKNFDSIDEANKRTVVVPLSIDQIKEFFENKNLFFLVNYGNSKIKGNMFLTYLSNLDLPFEIILDGATKQEKFDLLKIFMETRNQSNSDVLRLTVADIILKSIGVSVPNWITNPILNEEECLEFIKINQETIQKWNVFLSSLMVYIPTCFPKLVEKLKPAEIVPHLKDSNYVGGNIVMLFDIPSFLELYFSKPYSGNLYYFDAQFEEHMFKGKNLFHYFNCPENTILQCANGLVTGAITLDIYKSFMEVKA